MYLKDYDISGLSDDEFQALELLLNAGAFRLLGIDWKKRVAWHVDFMTNSLVFEYE